MNRLGINDIKIQHHQVEYNSSIIQPNVEPRIKIEYNPQQFPSIRWLNARVKQHTYLNKQSSSTAKIFKLIKKIYIGILYHFLDEDVFHKFLEQHKKFLKNILLIFIILEYLRLYGINSIQIIECLKIELKGQIQKYFSKEDIQFLFHFTNQFLNQNIINAIRQFYKKFQIIQANQIKIINILQSMKQNPQFYINQIQIDLQSYTQNQNVSQYLYQNNQRNLNSQDNLYSKKQNGPFIVYKRGKLSESLQFTVNTQFKPRYCFKDLFSNK